MTSSRLLTIAVVFSLAFFYTNNPALASHSAIIDIHHQHTASAQDYGGTTENIIVHTLGIIATVAILVLNGVFTYKHLLASSSDKKQSKSSLVV